MVNRLNIFRQNRENRAKIIGDLPERDWIMRTYRLYLIRHGLTSGNLEGRYIGSTDLDLCARGAAELLTLKEQYEYPNVGRVYASPLKRCVETARILYPEMTPVTVDALREYSFGVFENRTPEELKSNPVYRKWLESAQEAIPKGAEPMDQFKERVLEGFHSVIMDMMQSGISDAAVITHGGVITSFLARCGLPKREMMEWKVGSGRGYTLLVNASLWANVRAAEVFTPIPYGTGMDGVMLDYQRELPADDLWDEEDDRAFDEEWGSEE